VSLTHPPSVLSIAGSDPSGGAGIQADLKTFAAHGVYGMAVITALTAQNTRAVAGVAAVDPDFVRLQLRTVLSDIRPDAVKIGMVGSAGIADAVADGLDGYDGPVVLDPVMVATSGAPLLEPSAEAALQERLVPRASLVTPNLPEAARLFGAHPPAVWARSNGIAVLLKDGHGADHTVTDRLFLPGGAAHSFAHPRVHTSNTHGTGCTLSSAIAARLAQGRSVADAVGEAVDWLAGVIAGSAHHRLGAGHGPLLHGALLRSRFSGLAG